MPKFKVYVIVYHLIDDVEANSRGGGERISLNRLHLG